MLTQTELKSLLHYDAETGIFTWKVNGNKSVKIGNVAGNNTRGYLSISIKNKNYFLHRLAWLYVYGKLPDLDIDHINRIKNDNRIKNLREVSKSQNSQNQEKSHSTNKTGVLGVTINIKNGRKSYRAIIGVNGKNIHLGYFKDLEQAKITYLKAKEIYHKGSEREKVENTDVKRGRI